MSHVDTVRDRAEAVVDRAEAPAPPREPDAPPAGDAAAVAALVEADLLVEDVSIDGMCGVY